MATWEREGRGRVGGQIKKMVAVQAEGYRRGRALSGEVTRFFEELEGAGVAGVPKRVGSGSCDTGEESEAGWVAPWGSMKEALSSHPESSGSVMELGAEAQHEQICISQTPFCCSGDGPEDWRDGGDQLGVLVS